MNKKILIGSIIAVVLLTLVSFSSVVGYSSVENNPDATPIEFELQRIRELVRSIDLRKIIVNPDAVLETLEEISSILEENEDCGCEDGSSKLEGDFQIICILLFPLYILSWYAFWFGVFSIPIILMYSIGSMLGCMWI